MTIKKTTLSPLSINDSGTPDIAITTPSATAHIANPKKSLTRKSAIIKANVLMIFTLASSLCMSEFPGKY